MLGGCAAILVYGKHNKELSRGYRLTTNNRMEIIALIIALEAIKFRCNLTIYSDSKYLISAFEKKWLLRWQASGWKTAAKKPVKNVDLWKLLDSLLSTHNYEFMWVKGHSGHYENTRCDELAVQACKSTTLCIDEEFEKLNDVDR